MIRDKTFIPSNHGVLTDTVSEQREKFQHPEKVLNWRKDQFERLGFLEYIADFLASTRIDLHQMEDLLSSGCAHTTAIEILIGTMWSGDDPNWGIDLAREDDTDAS